MAHSRISFIGAGNLARNLIAGLLRQGHPADRILVSTRTPESRAALVREFGVVAVASNLEAARAAETVVLAVKPQVLGGVCEELSALDFGPRLVISVAAGSTTGAIAKRLAQSPAIVRAMPNTPSRIGLGATGLFATADVEPAQRREAEHLFRSVGETAWVADEALMDVVTAVAGSGPAYYFAFMEAMQAAAEALGLPGAIAEALVRQTALGAVSLANQSPEPLSELRRQVVSPGGTTAAALAEFERGQLGEQVHRALAAAVLRGRELARAME